MLISNENRAKLSDFGLSKVKKSATASVYAGGKTAKGSMLWRAPELFQGARKTVEVCYV